MKIFFDWMHRKLQPVVANYSQFPQRKDEEIEKMEGVVVEEKEALLLHDMLRGILAIGTLGQFEDPFLLEPPYDIEEPVQQQEEVAAPAVKPVQLVNNKEEDQKAATLNEVEAKLLREDWPLLREDKEGRERGRTTLANLFAADPMAKEECNNNSGIEQLHQVKKKKTRDPIKSCTNSSNKNNKLQKLMTRLLKKKKIHPENLNMGGEAGVQRSSLVY
ncbi:protein TILLER ANGLE CONTROL 1-like [Zingiber officinale]|uniref:protein TILLER ANGLE CONTROL 1-like n=1 Tax=Zingiber officinale TaxID=94328 RepID=UPI001C4CE106|nr:protein TILLER ANGLE CONTROL 1-like [Zingiber officinale]